LKCATCHKFNPPSQSGYPFNNSIIIIQPFNSSIISSSIHSFTHPLTPSFLPRHQRRFIKINPPGLHPFCVVSEPHFVLVPTSTRSGSPGQLRDTGQAWEYHVFDFIHGGYG